ncbi:MAG: GtrA family protein [Oscillospiraceae bacterium]|nr:GtrA family protein [Oscillospiraceae bacterium]
MEQRVRFKDLFLGPAMSGFIEFFRSLFVGGAAFVADFSVLALLKEFAGVSTLISATLGFAAGVTVNYLLSAFWAFRSSNIKSHTARFLIFIAIAALGLLINNVIIAAFDGPLAEGQVFGSVLIPERYYMAGKIVATVIVFFWNFISRKVFLFRGTSKKS